MCKCSSSRSSSRPCCRPWTPGWWCSCKRWRRSSRLRQRPTVSTPWSRGSPLSTRYCSESATHGLSVTKTENVISSLLLCRNFWALSTLATTLNAAKTPKRKRPRLSCECRRLHLSGCAFKRRTTSAVANVASAYCSRPMVSEPINSSLFHQLAEQLQQQNLEQFQKQLLEHQQKVVAVTRMRFLQRVCTWTCAWTAYQWRVACSRTKSHINTSSWPSFILYSGWWYFFFSSRRPVRWFTLLTLFFFSGD